MIHCHCNIRILKCYMRQLSKPGNAVMCCLSGFDYIIEVNGDPDRLITIGVKV